MHAAKHYALSTAVQPAMTMCEASIDRQARRCTPHTNCATRERVKLAYGATALPSVQDFCSVCRKSKRMEGHARMHGCRKCTACTACCLGPCNAMQCMNEWVDLFLCTVSSSVAMASSLPGPATKGDCRVCNSRLRVGAQLSNKCAGHPKGWRALTTCARLHQAAKTHAHHTPHTHHLRPTTRTHALVRSRPCPIAE